MIKKLMAVLAMFILIVIGIEAWRRYRLGAMRVEAYHNLRWIMLAEKEYMVENDRYVACPRNPGRWHSGPGASDPRPWDRGTAFDQIGFTPDGKVRYQYSVCVSEDGRSCLIEASGDLDEDGKVCVLTLASGYNEFVMTGDDW